MRNYLPLATASLVAALTLALAPARAAEPAPIVPLTLDQIFAEDSSGRRPEGQVFSPDGKRLAWTWDAGDGVALWVATPGEAAAAATAPRPRRVARGDQAGVAASPRHDRLVTRG